MAMFTLLMRCFEVSLSVWMRASGITTFFRHAALTKCERRLAFWLHHGADLSRGTASRPDLIALDWARASNASPEILRLLIS